MGDLRIPPSKHNWISNCTTSKKPGFERKETIEIFLDESQVAFKIGHEEDIARNILEEARDGKHETIVVGRHGTSRIKRLFGGGVTDQLLRDAKGFAIWVVE